MKNTFNLRFAEIASIFTFPFTWEPNKNSDNPFYVSGNLFATPKKKSFQQSAFCHGIFFVKNSSTPFFLNFSNIFKYIFWVCHTHYIYYQIVFLKVDVFNDVWKESTSWTIEETEIFLLACFRANFGKSSKLKLFPFKLISEKSWREEKLSLKFHSLLFEKWSDFGFIDMTLFVSKNPLKYWMFLSSIEPSTQKAYTLDNGWKKKSHWNCYGVINMVQACHTIELSRDFPFAPLNKYHNFYASLM